jgi:hypothetical protein
VENKKQQQQQQRLKMGERTQAECELLTADITKDELSKKKKKGAQRGRLCCVKRKSMSIGFIVGLVLLMCMVFF